MLSPSWPHAPAHQLSKAGTYMVTAGTYLRAHRFGGRERLAVLQRGLLKVALDFGWRLEAWAVFSNHYHFVGHSPGSEAAESLSGMLATLHMKTTTWVNRLDGCRGRKVWHNFWETRLTYQRSYLARLNYVHQNALKHGLVLSANQYPWCSAAWFERTVAASTVRSIYRFDARRVKTVDAYEVSAEW